MKWLQDNPLDARYITLHSYIKRLTSTNIRMGYQKKGYTSGEIATAWIEDWDKLTKAKAKGRY
jgi:hypothetical protein